MVFYLLEDDVDEVTYPKNTSTFKTAVRSSMPLQIYPQPSERSTYVSWIKW